jgi:hypothetical protein
MSQMPPTTFGYLDPPEIMRQSAPALDMMQE